MSDYLDLLAASQASSQKKKSQVIFDGVQATAEDDLSAYELADIKLSVAGAVQSLIETDDLDDDESLIDRLDALMIGIVDADKNGEIDDDEAVILEIAYNALAEFLAQKGVSEDDIDAIINNSDEEVAKNVVELLQNTAPDGEDAEIEEVNNFAFDADSDASVYDAVYKRKVVVRNGKKAIIKKRVAGRVKLSAAQKQAVKKMLRKSHSSAARRARMKSMKRRASMGI